MAAVVAFNAGSRSGIVKSVGPATSTTHATRLDAAASVASLFSRVSRAPRNAARCPPADVPIAPMCSGSTPYVAALVRIQRTARWTSSSCVGHGFVPLASEKSRYSMLNVTYPASTRGSTRPVMIERSPTVHPPGWIRITAGRRPARAGGNPTSSSSD
jgi:hypothetical protein